MHRFRIVVLICIVGISRRVSAQGCVPPEHPLFEFQTETPAVFVGDSTMRPRPISAQRASALKETQGDFVVGFVVDTLGKPDVASLKIVRATSAAAADSVRATLALWRYRPALAHGCKVSEMILTAVER